MRFAIPKLRKVREAWGTPCVYDVKEIKNPKKVGHPAGILFAKTLVLPTLSALGEGEKSLDLPHTLVEQSLLPWSA